MDNLKLPAYPLINQEGPSLEDREVFKGFTKLEKAAVEIAAGMVQGTWVDGMTTQQLDLVKETAISVARAILKECSN